VNVSSVPGLVQAQVAVVPDRENWPLAPHGDPASAPGAPMVSATAITASAAETPSAYPPGPWA